MAGSGRLRLSIAANLLAAVAVTFGLSAVALLAVSRGALVRRTEAEVGRLAEVVAAAVQRGIDPVSSGLVPEAVSFAWVDEASCAPCVRVAGPAGRREVVAERVVAGRAFTVGIPLASLQAPLGEFAGQLLLFLSIAGLLLVVVGALLLERGLVTRLTRLDEALGGVERDDLQEPLRSSGEGDEIGRLVGVVRRVGARLREDRANREAYIRGLEAANRELREARAELLRSEKLATVGRLAAGVAHEIGNPLAAVLGYVEVLRLQSGPLPAEYADRIERELRRIDRIVRDLLEFARPRPMVLEPVSLAAAVEQARRLVEPQPRWRTVALEVALPAGLPAVVAQSHYLTQVLVNLLINAADAMKGEGRVRVEGSADESGGVVLRIADSGPGIAPDAVGRVFDPFFTTKAPGEGTGLGLAISHALMLQFGGAIEVQASGGPGAVFILRFRRAAGDVPTP